MQDIETILQESTTGATTSRLRRAVLSYGDWYIFLQEQDARERIEGKKAKPRLFTDQDGRKHTFLFRDPSNITNAKPPFEPLGETLRSSGEWAFRSLSLKTDVVHLVGDKTDIEIPSSEFQAFVQLSKEIQVEAALATIENTTAKLPEMLQRVCAFDSYWLAVHHKDGGALPAVIERGGKKYLAIFTAKDTLDAFLSSIEEDPAMALSQEGASLFLYVSRVEKIDGVIFNGAGPVPPHFFSMDFIGSLLKANTGLIRKAAFRRLLTRSTFAFKADELSSLSEAQNRDILALFYLSMLADGEIKEGEYHFMQEVLSMLPWRWGVGQAHTLEIANELRVKFTHASSADLSAEVSRLCAQLSPSVPREKLLVGLFAQLLSDSNFAEKERIALQRYASLFELPPERAKAIISEAVSFLNTIVS